MTEKTKSKSMEVDETNDSTEEVSADQDRWYYDTKTLLHDTPSRKDGVDRDTEGAFRKAATRFIIELGSKMELGYNTVATGVVYFHRFYMVHSFRKFPKYTTACACLFLAGKVEETPKKCRDIIKMAETLLRPEELSKFGKDPKDEMMVLERILLQSISFDIQVAHPYGFLLRYGKNLKGDRTSIERVIQMAWTFVNDSLCTTLCLQWEPEIIAIAMLYLAAKLSKYEVVDWEGRIPDVPGKWWDEHVSGLDTQLLEDICHQVLDLYANQDVKDVQAGTSKTSIGLGTAPVGVNKTPVGTSN